MNNLVKKFSDAGLLLKLLDTPIVGSNATEIVQINIGRKVKGSVRDEWFEIFPGHKENRIEVLNVDKKIKQLVLFVHEPIREFETNFSKRPKTKGYDTNLRDGFKRRKQKFHENETEFIVTEKTDGNKRHFLMGVDERQLFIAQLRDAVSTVTAARNSLGATVEFHEGKRKMTPGRQGEWFFVKTSSAQEEHIEDYIAANRTFIQYKKNIGEVHGSRSGGNPHIADEIVVIPRSQNTEAKFRKRNGKLITEGMFPIRSRTVFIRGCIRHIDHKTIKYTHWHEVIGNREGATDGGNSSGVSWID